MLNNNTENYLKTLVNTLKYLFNVMSISSVSFCGVNMIGLGIQGYLTLSSAGILDAWTIKYVTEVMLQPNMTRRSASP
jgi:hypothetical protein